MVCGGKLAGKRALVTGAGTGLGRETALELAREGADVVVHWNRSAQGAESAVEEIQSMGGRAAMLRANLEQTSACLQLAEEAIGFLGGLDILINNAGITTANRSFLEVTPENYDTLFNVNMRAQFFCAQCAARQMLQQESRGVIINITSIHGCTGFPGCSVYDGTKGAIWAWTRELAVELGPLGIRVNGIAPGRIVVERDGHVDPDRDPITLGTRLVPWRRLGKPIDIAKACVYLASEDSDYVVGQVLIVDGGVTARTALRLEALDADCLVDSGQQLGNVVDL